MDYEDHEEGGDDKDSETRLEEALELYDRAVECERDNREAAKEDIEFGLLSDQWDETARKNRDREHQTSGQRLPSEPPYDTCTPGR